MSHRRVGENAGGDITYYIGPTLWLRTPRRQQNISQGETEQTSRPSQRRGQSEPEQTSRPRQRRRQHSSRNEPEPGTGTRQRQRQHSSQTEANPSSGPARQSSRPEPEQSRRPRPQRRHSAGYADLELSPRRRWATFVEGSAERLTERMTLNNAKILQMICRLLGQSEGSESHQASDRESTDVLLEAVEMGDFMAKRLYDLVDMVLVDTYLRLNDREPSGHRGSEGGSDE